MHTTTYDPCTAGTFPVARRTFHATDESRARRFPYDIWYPASADSHPLILFSHHAGGHRGASSFLCTHLASHGYIVASMDHSEVVVPELARPDHESPAERDSRSAAAIAARIPDALFLLNHLLLATQPNAPDHPTIDATRIGVVGHSFGGWTALAMPDVERRVRAVVALSPGGTGHHRAGLLPLTLDFAWCRDVPTLCLAAEHDVPIPPADVFELYDRTPATTRIVVLARADHMHFVDNVEEQHEAARATSLPSELAWLTENMRPITELCSSEQAHAFTRGLTLAHLDATLRDVNAAHQFLSGDLQADFAARHVDVLTALPN